ncbi:MAG: glycosyltransferase family 39 protein [Micropruina sp.]|uniref:ArnT family glycosyltransferase n=1 Tax=Micropruina sp. TaxID=2737536 RepID=UPI0039E72288
MTTTTISSPTATAPAGPPDRLSAGLSPRVRRGSLAATLLAVAALYTWNLAASGWANSFYSAAVQAGTQSWTAFFYGSLDAGNSITVDKTPASLWLMELSARVFGLSSWSILLPQALLGVASAWILYGTVRRSLARGGSARRAHWAGIVAALAFALTPAATLMFRFNNPDALMVFCYVAAAALTLRAAETASRWKLAAAGALIGLGFLAKMLQAFVILPSLVLAYAIGAPASWRKKVVDLLTAFGAMVLAFGWWVAIVELVPESWRPYIGGSQTNSILELTFGYNGLGRLNGDETGSVGNASGRWGQLGLLRMFTTVSGEMVSWLIPAALLLGLAALLLIGRRGWATTFRAGAETHRTRANAALVLFGSWLVINTLVFSFMAGIYHDYYTVALAPAIGGTLAVGGALAWTHRRTWLGRGALAAAALGTGAWGVALASVPGGAYRTTSLVAAAVLTGSAVLFTFGRAVVRPLQTVAVTGAVVAGLPGPAAYSLNTAATPHTGSIVTAGPARSGISGGAGGGGGADGGGRQGGGRQGGGGQGGGGQGRSQAGQGQGQSGQGQGQSGQGQSGRGQSQSGQGQQGTTPGAGQSPQGSRSTGGGRGGGAGGLLNGATVSSELLAALQANASDYTWVAATTGAQNAASYQLASGYPVMAIGGFNGSDPSPTLAQFQEWVAQGKVHYFIGGGNFGGQNGGSRSASEIANWVQQNYSATTVGNTTVYDLTAAK